MGPLFRKYIGLVDIGLVAVCHEITAEIVRMGRNNHGKNESETKGEERCFIYVDVRMSKPLEDFYKNLLESNRGYAWRQDLSRLRKNAS